MAVFVRQMTHYPYFAQLRQRASVRRNQTGSATTGPGQFCKLLAREDGFYLAGAAAPVSFGSGTGLAESELR